LITSFDRSVPHVISPFRTVALPGAHAPATRYVTLISLRTLVTFSIHTLSPLHFLSPRKTISLYTSHRICSFIPHITRTFTTYVDTVVLHLRRPVRSFTAFYILDFVLISEHAVMTAPAVRRVDAICDLAYTPLATSHCCSFRTSVRAYVMAYRSLFWCDTVIRYARCSTYILPLLFRYAICSLSLRACLPISFVCLQNLRLRYYDYSLRFAYTVFLGDTVTDLCLCCYGTHSSYLHAT